jgi:predicted 3-demethylubiquinone-9 3-methyltransferase (glyoxalase superfamily)
MPTPTASELVICLWFDGQAEAAAQHYLDVFRDGRVTKAHRPDPAGPALTVAFELRGRRFLALNGGPHFKFTPAVSLMVDCADQAEIDYYWERLGEGGKESRCGWLADKFGLSWQILPKSLPELLARGPGVMKAMMQMAKLDIAALERAGET